MKEQKKEFWTLRPDKENQRKNEKVDFSIGFPVENLSTKLLFLLSSYGFEKFFALDHLVIFTGSLFSEEITEMMNYLEKMRYRKINNPEFEKILKAGGWTEN